MDEDRPVAQTKAELWRTIVAVVQVTLAVATLSILIIVHFL